MGAVFGTALGTAVFGKPEKKPALPQFAFHEAAKHTKCQCGDPECAMSFEDWDPDWFCHLCDANPSDFKWVYAETAMGTGFKLVCSDCAAMFKQAYTTPLRKQQTFYNGVGV
jgi:hypothetical protein